MPVRIEAQAEPIPGYRLIAPLGRGGFGEVWKCEAPGGILKAIKFVHAPIAEEDEIPDTRHLEQELKSLSRVKDIRHPFLLSLDRFEVVQGQLLIVSELADRDLNSRMKECHRQGLPGIPRDELLRYLEEAAEVLDLMNTTYDLQHLDVKPHNLFLVLNHVKVADFGLVKDLQGRVGSVTGGLTPLYAAPEACKGTISRFSDQYSLAVVFQELLTGRHPISGNNPMEIMLRHVEAAPELTPLPAVDRPVVARALAKEPAQRFPSCLAFIHALRQADRPRPLTAALEALTPVPAPDSTRMTAANLLVPGAAALNQALAPSVPGAPPPLTEPALVIGVGGSGLAVLRQFRRACLARGDDQGLPANLALLGIDTDLAAAERAAQGDPAEALPRDDLFLARLSRPLHYLRPRATLPPWQHWLSPKVVQRIPRSLTPEGHRGLGRLALVDHYPAVAGRLRRLLAAVTVPAADGPAHPGGPRVVIAAGLAGGTGGGMFLDLAFAVRGLLRDQGYERPEVLGLFLLPGPEADTAPGLAQANAYAALVELNHFSSGQPFEAYLDPRAGALRANEPPFATCVVLAASAAGPEAAAQQAGEYLYRRLLTPLGAEVERLRPPSADPDAPGPRFRSVGVSTLVPRQQKRQRRQEARRLAAGVIGRWLAKPAAEAVAPVRQAVQAGLRERGLDPPAVLQTFQDACTQSLGQRPDDLLAQWLEPLGCHQPGPWFDLARARRTVDRIDQLLGPPGEDGVMKLARLPALLRERTEDLAAQARDYFVSLLEPPLNRPGGRVALAEEALQQAGGTLERWFQMQERPMGPVTARADAVAAQVHAVLEELEQTPAPANRAAEAKQLRRIGDLAQALAEYPLLRYQQVLWRRLTGLYLHLREEIKTFLLEVGRYRSTLAAFLEEVWEVPLTAPAPGTPEVYREVDEAFQEELDRRFRGPPPWPALLTPGHVGEVGDALFQAAQGHLARHAPEEDAAQTLLAEGSEARLLQDLQVAYDAARPALPGLLPAGRHWALALVPGSAAGQQLVQTAQRLLPDLTGVTSVRPDEVVFYREILDLTVAELGQQGLVSRAAYEQALGSEQRSPHARLDQSAWKPLETETALTHPHPPSADPGAAP